MLLNLLINEIDENKMKQEENYLNNKENKFY